MSEPSVFDEVLEAGELLTALDDVARAEAWGSSALSVWREHEDAEALDRELVVWLLAREEPTAALVLLAVADGLGLDEVIVEGARERLVESPPWVDHVGTARPTRAWEVAEGAGRSIGIGFVHGDGSELSLLADLDGPLLTALVVAPGPDDLFAEAEDVVAPRPLGVTEAAESVVAGWRALQASAAPPPESVLVNAVIARRRLSVVLGDPLDELLVVVAVPPVDDDMDPGERAELDAWALATLTTALGAVDPDVEVADELLDPFTPERRAMYPAEEREAFAALEWADWLGAVIGLVRTGEGADASPRALVDHVNRCPEVTSTIPRADRPYYEWAFQHVVLLWQRHGIVSGDRRLTPQGRLVLPAVLARAWEPGPPATAAPS